MYSIAGLALSFLLAGVPSGAAAQCFAVNALGAVNSMSGKPFQAEVHEAIPTLDWRLYPVRERKSIVARDSQGRVRTEVYVGMISFNRDSGEEIDSTYLLIEICDPVGQRQIMIDQQKKTARLIHLQSVPMQNQFIQGVKFRFCKGQMDVVTNSPAPDREDLGHRNIEGVEVHGVAVRAPNLETEIWCSDELGTVVSREMRGVARVTMTNIHRAEPDPALFVIPAGYKTDFWGESLTTIPASKLGDLF
jgi:hypothetical protein